MNSLKEICGECGLPFADHYAGVGTWKPNACPATPDGADFEQGPGTTFKSTGEYHDSDKKL